MRRNTDIRFWENQATRQSNDEIYPLVALGCPIARDQMIRGNVGLVIAKVDTFLKLLPGFSHLRDDMISNGFVGLVEAVNRMVNEEFVNGANPTGLMAVCIQSHFGKTIEAEQTIRVPTRTQKRKKSKGIDLSPPAREFSDYSEEEMEEAFTYDPRNILDLRETLDACCETDEDRKIIEMREQGYVDREIAEVLGLPLTTTYVMRRTIYARFLALTGWKGEA